MTALIKTLPLLTVVAAAVLLAGCRRGEPVTPATASVTTPVAAGGQEGAAMVDKIVKTDAEWRKILTPEQYNVLRKAGTEPAFSSPLDHETRDGVYECAACGLPLYSSEAKYDSGTGWPSFYEPIGPTHVITRPDNGLFTRRTEVLCARCGGHLGHVFKDGPPPTGLRYCMNGVALEFVPAGEAEAR